jgi:hypothetical protein
MGTVYQARDEKLERTFAIKVLFAGALPTTKVEGRICCARTKQARTEGSSSKESGQKPFFSRMDHIVLK